MRRIVFYSWQSDLPNSTNRGFIQSALEESAKKIVADDSIAVEPVVDRDTQNVPGSPDIASTIFSKISSADIFVADVTIVTRAKNMRPSPNPNVLIELGYALKTLGPERIVLVFNKSFGKIEELPFDLRMRRALVYEMPESAPERAPERKKLEGQFEEALRITLRTIPDPEPIEISLPVVTALESAQPNRRIILRKYLDELLKKIIGIEPKKNRDGGTADELIAGIENSQELVAEFSKISELISVMDDFDSAKEVYRWFGKIFEKYNLPEGYTGMSSSADHDFFRFIGHEMFVTVIGSFIREQHWETLVRLIGEPIPMYIPNRGPGNVNWEYASKHLPSLTDESRKRSRISLHGDLLEKRHGNGGGLSTIMSMQDFIDADFFLFLLSRTVKNSTGMGYWFPWSCLYMKTTPMFIQNAERKEIVEEIIKVLGLKTVDDFKKLLTEQGRELEKLFSSGWWKYPIEQTNIDRIGTR